MNAYSIVYLYGGSGLFGLVQWDENSGVGRLVGMYQSEDEAADNAANLSRLEYDNWKKE